ncbi:MAG: hypothetical protein ACTSRS_02215 [Candidatus Helarchaeota archaeon]
MTKYQLESDYLRLILDVGEKGTSEKIEIKEQTNMIPILSSLDGYHTLLFIKKAKISHEKLVIKSQTDSELILEGVETPFQLTLKISLMDPQVLHFKYTLQCPSTLKISKLIALYSILLHTRPTFIWVPHLRPKKHYVIGDHVFRSPVIMYCVKNAAFAFIPDLDLLKTNRPFQSFLDLNLSSEAIGGVPHLCYGFGNYTPTSHIFFKHNPSKYLKIKKDSPISFGYYLKFFRSTPVHEILSDVNAFLWQSYGRPLLHASFAPQVLPYRVNVEEGLKAIFDRHGYWADFTVSGQECGGIFQNSWMGKRKKKLQFITPEKVKKHKSKNISQIAGQESFLGKLIMHFSNSPWWIRRFDWFTRTFPIITRTAEIWNNAWFLNIRTGYGLRCLGELWGNQELVDKGNKILNTVLNLPRVRGVFPSVIFPAAPNTSIISTINGLKAFIYIDDYHLVDTSLTMYWALKYYQDFKPRPEIIEKSAELVDLLAEIQQENGAIPTFIGFEADQKTPLIRDLLLDSASSGAALMFLTEYYKSTKDTHALEIAEKIAQYLQSNIIPINKWHDFEPFFSCTHFPLDLFCNYTNSHVMNALCIYWCAEGFKELYRISDNPLHLQLGERILAILSLFQQIWNLPYISYNTFGGFGSQNADAELSDARQGLFVRTYVEYYLLTGKKEYMERAIATLRACWAMQLLNEYKEQCPGNLKGINTLNGVDRGCVCENYGHSGHDLRIPGYIMFDWGVGTSIQATAYVKKAIGDLFLDFKEQLAWGIDGLVVKNATFSKARVELTLEILPRDQSFTIKARAVPQDFIELIINGNSLGNLSKTALETGFSASF